jgi:hypothetical protein
MIVSNIIAQSAGVNVNATIPERMIAVAIVIANYKNSHWTRHKGNWNKKTAAIKNVIAIIAPAISSLF